MINYNLSFGGQIQTSRLAGKRFDLPPASKTRVPHIFMNWIPRI